jgi:type II secretory pathway pseudopilin PulG
MTETEIDDIEALQTALAETRAALAEAQGRAAYLALEAAFRAAAHTAGLRPDSVAEALALAAESHAVDGEGQPVDLATGEAADLSAWLETQRADHPGWWPESSGGGAEGVVATSLSGGITLTRDQARDPARYRAAREASSRTGLPLAILG